MDAQSLAHFLIIFLVLIGNIGMFMMSGRKSKIGMKQD